MNERRLGRGFSYTVIGLISIALWLGTTVVVVHFIAKFWLASRQVAE